MSFRDDRDALLARAEAAEREIERLREDNARLERELASAAEDEPRAPRAIGTVGMYVASSMSLVGTGVGLYLAYELFGDNWGVLVGATLGLIVGIFAFFGVLVVLSRRP